MIEVDVRGFGCVIATDQWFGQPVRMMNIVVPKTAFDTKAIVICRALATIDLDDPVILDQNCRLAANAAKRTN